MRPGVLDLCHLDSEMVSRVYLLCAKSFHTQTSSSKLAFCFRVIIAYGALCASYLYHVWSSCGFSFFSQHYAAFWAWPLIFDCASSIHVVFYEYNITTNFEVWSSDHCYGAFCTWASWCLLTLTFDLLTLNNALSYSLWEWWIHSIIITHAEDSRTSKAFSGICVWFCV